MRFPCITPAADAGPMSMHSLADPTTFPWFQKAHCSFQPEMVGLEKHVGVKERTVRFLRSLYEL